jgi:hypothetical protein
MLRIIALHDHEKAFVFGDGTRRQSRHCAIAPATLSAAGQYPVVRLVRILDGEVLAATECYGRASACQHACH